MKRSGTTKTKTAPDPMHWIEKGDKYSKRKQYKLAEDCFRKVLDLDPALPTAELAQMNLASLLSETGRYKEAKPIWRALLSKNPDDSKLLEKLIGVAMVSGDLRDAAKYAEKHAALCVGYHGQKAAGKKGERAPAKEGQAAAKKSNLSIQAPCGKLSVQKLKHDIAQFQHLQKQGVKIDGIETIIKNYKKVLKRLLPLGDTARVALNDADYRLIGQEYNRIIYRPHTPRVRHALSHKWDVVSAEDGISAEDDYLNHPYGLTVIDNFLSAAALSGLRKFCLESTVWFENRYSYGRLGAFFREGFNCPMLIQIGEEIRTAFPRIIGQKHPLLQIWGFKCDHFQPVTPPHADFAAVNVNFWITPEEANLDQDSGGMTVYDVEAPLNWDFDSYNNQGDKITALLKKKKASAATIPYKANRAIIFNSDLFHVTSPVQFADDYPLRRINVTLLYGKREDSHLPSR